MKFLPVILLPILFCGCATKGFKMPDGTMFVQNDFLNKKRADRTSLTVTDPKTGAVYEFNSTVMGMDNTSVANTVAGTYGLVSSLQETTAQRVSDNALKASQAKEATAQSAIQAAPTVYAPAEQAVSRAGGAVVIP